MREHGPTRKRQGLGKSTFYGTFGLQKFDLFTVPVDKMNVGGRKDVLLESWQLDQRQD
jgi:hypothetical protein